MGSCQYLYRMDRRRWLAAWMLAAGLWTLLVPSQTAGDAFKLSRAVESEVARVRSVLDQHGARLGESTLEQLAYSIVQESKRHGLDAMLLLAVIYVESRFDPRAVSDRGALGLMQLRPDAVTALVELERISALPPGADLKDPLINVRLGASYLALLHEMFGDFRLSLAAYNQGPTRVRSSLDAREKPSLIYYADQVLSIQRALERGMTLAGER